MAESLCGPAKSRAYLLDVTKQVVVGAQYRLRHIMTSCVGANNIDKSPDGNLSQTHPALSEKFIVQMKSLLQVSTMFDQGLKTAAKF